MKVLKKIVGYVSLLLVGGGAFFLFWQYFRNKQMFTILLSNSVVRGSLPIIQKMLLSVVAIIAGLLMFIIYLKISGVVRRSEREKRAALKEAQKENEELNKKLKQEADEAKAEAEKAKQETELMRKTFMRKREEENNTEEENEQA